MVAGGQPLATAIAVDSTTLYWGNGGDMGVIAKAPISGGSPVTLATDVVQAVAIAVNGTNVYWGCHAWGGEPGLVYAPLGGGPSTTLISGLADAIALTTADVYWLDTFDGQVFRMPLTGGAVTTVASGETFPRAIVADGQNVYWTTGGDASGSNGTVMRAPLIGGPAVTLASGQPNAYGIAVDVTSIYWSDEGTRTANVMDGTVMSLPLSGGTPTTLASGQSPGSIAIDASRIYWGCVDASKTWTGASACICSMPLSGGTITTLASDLTGVVQIVVDATNIYWTTGSAIMKLPK